MKELQVRKPNRLKGYDYSQKSAYFITICAKDRSELFGYVVGAVVNRPKYVELTEIQVVKCVAYRRWRWSPWLGNTFRQLDWCPVQDSRPSRRDGIPLEDCFPLPWRTLPVDWIHVAGDPPTHRGINYWQPVALILLEFLRFLL